MHEHKWRLAVHMDQCHAYSSTYSCECGASATSYDERDPIADPYSFVWMDEEGREPCVRCTEIKAGAQIVTRLVVVDKDGKEELHKEELLDQGTVNDD
jgi:hypothetical protein